MSPGGIIEIALTVGMAASLFAWGIPAIRGARADDLVIRRRLAEIAENPPRDRPSAGETPWGDVPALPREFRVSHGRKVKR